MSASSKKKLRKEQNAAALTEKQRKEQTEAKKLKISSIIFVVVMVAVLVTALAIMTVSGIRSSGIIEKNTIALTVGDHKINTVEMNYYFTDTVNNYYQEWTNMYGEYVSLYLSTMGLDPTLPLDQQSYSSEGMTWADYFMEQAIEQAKANYALYDQAIAEGYTLTEDDQISIDSNMSMMEMYAALSGRSVDEYLQLYYGSGANEKSIREYMEVATVSSAYYADHEAALSYDDAAIRAYEADQYQNYSSYSYNSYYLNYSSFLSDDAAEDPTDAQTDTAVAEAKVAAESLLTATNAEEFDAAIAALEVNADNTSAASTKYENVLYPNVIDNIQSWVADASRQANDIAAIPYESAITDDNGNDITKVLGYYVVQFVRSTDNTEPMANVRHLLVQFEEDEEGNVSDEAKSAAKTEADGYLTTWQNGDATEESFIALVQEHSDDSSASTGGLFEDINPDSAYVENFLNWSVDPARVAGDAEVIETEYGYHVMYYVGDDELSYRDYMIITEMTAADMEDWYASITDAVTVVEGNLSRVTVDLILSAS